MGKGDVDGYYVIFPRGACGDSIKVWCFNMASSSPQEYIDVDPALNYGVSSGLDAPCIQLLYNPGKSWFNKVGNFLLYTFYLQLRYIIPHYTTPQRNATHHTIPYHTTSHHITPHHTTPCHNTPYHTTPHHNTPHHTTPHHTTPHHTTPQHNTTQHTTPQHNRHYTSPCHTIPRHGAPSL